MWIQLFFSLSLLFVKGLTRELNRLVSRNLVSCWEFLFVDGIEGLIPVVYPYLSENVEPNSRQRYRGWCIHARGGHRARVAYRRKKGEYEARQGLSFSRIGGMFVELCLCGFDQRHSRSVVSTKCAGTDKNGRSAGVSAGACYDLVCDPLDRWLGFLDRFANPNCRTASQEPTCSPGPTCTPPWQRFMAGYRSARCCFTGFSASGETLLARSLSWP